MEPIKLTFYTSNASAYRYAKPQKAKFFKPQWYKDLPAIDKEEFMPQNNMRLCYGFNELFNKGLIMPLWNQTRVRIGKEGDTDYEWIAADRQSVATVHPPIERGSYLPESQYSHLKLHSSWLVVCDEKIQFLYTQNTWMMDNPEDVVIPNGILEFYYNRDIHMNVFIKRHQKERVVSLETGHPYVQLIPLSDRPIEIETKLIDSVQWDLMNSEANEVSLFASQPNKKRMVQDNGCPFSNKS